MKLERLLIGGLFFTCALTLASCDNSKPTPVEQFATITVIDGTGGGQYKIGSEATITADVKEDKTFKEWTVNDEAVSTDNPYTFTVIKDETYTATYSESNQVTIEVINGTGSGTYDKGATVNISPTLQTGDEFIKWTIKGEEFSTKQDYSFTAANDLVIKANIARAGELAEASNTLTMEGDEFTILNLTDIQLHNGNTVDFTKYIIDKCLEYKKPDLITILGDIINDHPDYDADQIAPKIFELIESYQIPWAPIFGNHDQKGYQKPPQSIKSIGEEELKAMLESGNYPHCLYLPGPQNVEGLSNYMVHIEDEHGRLKQSLIFLDSLMFGLNNTHVTFYENCMKYIKVLNDGKLVPSVVFDHIPLPQYTDEYDRFIYDDLRGVNGCCGTRPDGHDNSETLLQKFIDYGSTKTMLCGHDHFNSYYTELNGIKLGFAMKSSCDDDPGGNPYKYLMGGCYLTIDGVHEDKIEYHPTNDYEYEVEAGVENGFDYHFAQVVNWRGSGAKLNFKIRLPDTGIVKINIQGNNMRNPNTEKAILSWNRLTNDITLDASNKTVTKGTLSLIEDDLYEYELDLMDTDLNNTPAEKSYGDETARLVYFHDNNMNFKISNIHMEYEEITETDQIDLSNATIAPIEDQLYQKGMVIKPDVKVTLNGKNLTLFNDYAVRYKNNRELGTATVEVTPSGKGAHTYKGIITTTFNIVGNPFRGEPFVAGQNWNFDEPTSLDETFVFDVHFTSGSNTTMWFMLCDKGDNWDNYFGYFGLKADGTLEEQYSGIILQQVEDDFVRVNCDIKSLPVNKKVGNPTKVNMFYIRGDWGNNPTGYIDFDLSDAPGVVRGEKFIAGTDKSITFDKIEVTETVIVDFKFTSGADTHLNFFIGNSNDGWSRYNGYYKLLPNATLGETEPGISIDTLEDGYIRLTLDLDALTKTSDKGAPTPEEGYNLFYIRGAWTTGEGYVDFNPVIS